MELGPPAFIDIFGAIGFAYITAVAFWALKAKRPLPRWVALLLLLTGLIGLLADSFIVYWFLLK